MELCEALVWRKHPQCTRNKYSEYSVILFSVEIRTVTKKRDSVLKMLTAVLGPTKAAPGCLAARLYSGAEHSQAVLLSEEWRSRADFELSLYPARIKAIMAAIRLSTQPPIVRLDTVERREGLDGLAFHLRQHCTSRDHDESCE